MDKTRKYSLMKRSNWKKYSFEFLSIFIAVISAFALNNWNENRRDYNAGNKILLEIYNGLEKDIEDVRGNIKGHQDGLISCTFWRNVITDQEVSLDSLQQHYFNITRDFLTVQNRSGYETLKARGLELIQNDTLRRKIISLYEYNYSTLQKLEEEYQELQFQRNYFKEINQYIAPHFQFNEQGLIIGLQAPMNIAASDQNLLLSYLWKIGANRTFILHFYAQLEHDIIELRKEIEQELA